MDNNEFRKTAHEFVDWIADYLQDIDKYKVKPDMEPGSIFKKLPGNAPEKGEEFEQIFSDFNEIIMPGMTHWQHPKFFAYFPANSSYESILGEMLTSAIGAQCMIWQTSPAAAELEETVMNWLRDMTGLPGYFDGVIQDTASSATLCSILTAREKFSEYNFNKSGGGEYRFRVYCSVETHSSIDKAVKIAGLGTENLVKIAVDDNYSMQTEELEKHIQSDIEKGYTPLCVIATIGTTSSTAVDPIERIGEICKANSLWLHVDAAFAGTALILPEMRHFIKGIEMVDTFVFNPHKWMFTNFDCSAYFVKDKEALIRTFEIMPEYLKTASDSQVNNYRDWGIALGRRFRALKLWFVIRSYGITGLQEKLRHHIKLAEWVRNKMESSGNFEIMAPSPFPLICFRLRPPGVSSLEKLNALNNTFLEEINYDGKMFLTHTKLNGAYTLRMVTTQTYVTEEDVSEAWDTINKIAMKYINDEL